MGGGNITRQDLHAYSTKHIDNKRSVAEVFECRELHADLNPRGIIRESCDSVDNPNSTPVIIGLDVTGSMDPVLNSMARDGLKALVSGIYERKPVSDPHIMCMGIGDAVCDRAPLQVTQFEADIRMAEQLQKIWLEGHGGGNGSESYTLPWYFAATKTEIDSFNKREQKGFIFTIGDDAPNPNLTSAQIYAVLGMRPEFDSITSEEILEMVSQRYHVFHLIVRQGDNYRSSGARVDANWHQLLGNHAVPLTDYRKMGEVIISILQIANGADKQGVIDSWSDDIKSIVATAVAGLEEFEVTHVADATANVFDDID